MKKKRERGNIEKKRRRNIVNLKGKGKGKRRLGSSLLTLPSSLISLRFVDELTAFADEPNVVSEEPTAVVDEPTFVDDPILTSLPFFPHLIYSSYFGLIMSNWCR